MTTLLAGALSRKRTVLSLPALALLAAGTQAATIDLIQNGGFENTTITGSTGFGPAYPSQTVAGWRSSNDYSLVYAPGTADTTGAVIQGPVFGGGNFRMWGPGTGANNGLAAASPAGGNFIAIDASPQYTGPISQTITGLIPNQPATVSFYWAAAQQYRFNGANTEQLQVMFGNQSQSTSVLKNRNRGFEAWQNVSFSFTPTSSSQVLSFLAHGTPRSGSPFVFLDGVSVLQKVTMPTPEPASWILLVVSAAGLAGFARLRRKAAGSKS